MRIFYYFINGLLISWQAKRDAEAILPYILIEPLKLILNNTIPPQQLTKIKVSQFAERDHSQSGDKS